MAGQTIILRMTIENPIAGVRYSLQDADSSPVDPAVATGEPISFEAPVRVAEGPRFLGPFVRREGPERRFIYIAVGAQAGDPDCAWSRRAKIDIHDIPGDVLAQALAGKVIECRLPGLAKDGGPACGTVRPLGGWRTAG